MAGHTPWREIKMKDPVAQAAHKERYRVLDSQKDSKRKLEDFPDLFFRARTFGVVEDLSKELRLAIDEVLNELAKLKG